MSPARLRALDAASAANNGAPLGRSGAHLAGYSFQFDSAAVAPDEAARPSASAEWTLSETLDEVERRGATLRLGSGGVRLAHAHRLPDLARAVARHEGPLAVWLRLGLDRDEVQPVPFGATAWDAETRLRAAWFVRLFEAPPGRLAHRPGVSVTDLPAFRASIAGRLAAGPDAAGADGLRADLASLYERFGAAAERTVVPQPVR
ncbi:MAG TPA: hypothetical protein VF576_09015, partial [Rubricoccaceae bacterium]